MGARTSVSARDAVGVQVVVVVVAVEVAVVVDVAVICLQCRLIYTLMHLLLIYFLLQSMSQCVIHHLSFLKVLLLVHLAVRIVLM